MRFVFLDHIPSTFHKRNLIAEHHRTFDRHFDLMFECRTRVDKNALLTFAVDLIPNSGETIVVQRLADHRIDYLNYEGEISKNRGEVLRYAWGDYSGDWNIEGVSELTLTFSTESKNFADETWSISIGENQLWRRGRAAD